jgi:hypothetical protein
MKVIGCLSLDSPPRQRNENKAIYDEKLTYADPARNYCPGSGELKTVILPLIGRTHVERKDPPSKKAPIKPPTGRKKPPIKEPPDPPNPGHRRRDDQAPIGDPPPKRGPKRVRMDTSVRG